MNVVRRIEEDSSRLISDVRAGALLMDVLIYMDKEEQEKHDNDEVFHVLRDNFSRV